MESQFRERKLDELNRIVLPKEFTVPLGMINDEFVRIELHDDSIVLKKAFPMCAICSSSENLIEFENIYICTDHKNKIAAL